MTVARPVHVSRSEECPNGWVGIDIRLFGGRVRGYESPRSRKSHLEEQEQHTMLTNLVLLIPSLLATALFAYLIFGVIIYLRDLYKVGAARQERPAA